MRRILSAVVLITIIAFTIWALPVWATAVLAVIAAALAGVELVGLASRANSPLSAAFVGFTAAILVLAVAQPPELPREVSLDAVLLVFVLLPVGAGVVALGFGVPTPETLPRAAMLVMAPMYVGLPLGTLVWTRAELGPAAVTWLLATIAISDSAQYYTGRLLGRTKLSPAISPAKTVEGAIGGVVAAGLAGLALGPWGVPGWSPVRCGVIAVTLAIVGITGDLFESLLKRSAGVKDSSQLIPGHGGVLDRLDSYLFAAPVFYLLAALRP
jgi:phosphatidate cytidylyltransferase